MSKRENPEITEEERAELLKDLIRLGEEMRAVNPELFDANEHWINNPLIKPISKVAMFEDWEKRVISEEREALISELEAELEAVKELEDNPKYLLGFEHAVLFLKGSAE